MQKVTYKTSYLDLPFGRPNESRVCLILLFSGKADVNEKEKNIVFEIFVKIKKDRVSKPSLVRYKIFMFNCLSNNFFHLHLQPNSATIGRTNGKDK